MIGMEHSMMKTDWVIYTRDYCGYCSAAKRILDTSGQVYTEIALTEETQDEFNRLTSNARTVPQIFHNDVLVGGYTDLIGYLNKDAK